MKWTLIIGGFFVFGYFLVPLLFRAMKHHDYQNLYTGMQSARVQGGSFHENTGQFESYTDKLMYGDPLTTKKRGH